MRLAQHLVEQLALGAGPAGDLLAQPPVERPEVLLDLAEVGQQLAGVAGELLVAVALADGVEQLDLAPLGPGDLGVELGPPPAQLDQPALRVGVGAEDHLPQQLEQRVEPGLGADELPRGADPSTTARAFSTAGVMS